MTETTFISVNMSDIFDQEETSSNFINLKL